MRFSGLLFLLFMPPSVSGDILLEQDFEGDGVPGWRDAGRGTVRFTQYNGNTSVQLTQKKSVTLSLSTVGYENVAISMQLAAGELEKTDSCHAELSLDAGDSWQSIVSVRDGKDDGVTLYYGEAAPPALSNNPDVRVRFRASGKDRRDYCWGDNVRLTGNRQGAASANSGAPLPDETFFGSDALPGPFDMSAFAVPRDALPISEQRTATLQLSESRADGFEVHYDRFGYMANAGAQLEVFPGSSLSFVLFDGFVIPVNQDVLRLDHPNWEIAFQTGRAWQLSAETATARYSIPFALVEKNANCTHNGVLSWIVDQEGRSSRAVYQVASETCAYFKFDMWGSVATSIEPADAPASVVDSFAKHRRARLPVAAFAELAQRYPAVAAEQFGAVANMNPADTTVYGFVIDGVHYRGGCQTRYGAYPFCDELLLPSYSTAKSIFAGLAVMRMEAMLPGVSQRRIAEFLPECDAAGWGDITIKHALDMATGRYLKTGLEVDEANARHIEFLYAHDHATKVELACSLFPQQAEPGTTMVYHSSDTYLAGAALRALLEESDMPAGDVYTSLIVMPIWDELGLSQAVRSTRKTYDERAQPLFGWGLSYQSDDIARIGEWLVNGAELPADSTIDQSMFDAAMQQSDDRGLPVPGTASLRYNNGFWALDIADFIGCKNDVWTPFMSGFGGISVVLFPNNTVYYVFADGYIHRWREAAIESNKIRNMCQ